ncbi:MAG: antibiotic biosynthesis monooxygenase [Candidatus Competibacteraceae bacterium]|nr:antibiotic biosynthesis monooxygenase [Caldilineaceae bacterium]MCB1803625.1 antibiotic biosynthesis monooxygenase [Candidatus Competibacteraceae bacterium]MCB1811400.1 antibiotic biosynthesis monooxygenase [Candidatus Competibacteraceae bacterium]
MSATSPHNPPATVLITRRVYRGQERQFEQLMSEMQNSAATFSGHMGGFLIPPEQPEQRCYRVLFAFDTQAHLQAWMQSSQRKHWLRRLAEITDDSARTRILSGLETWFALPAAQTKAPPPRWKMALVTWLGIFPLVWLTSQTIAAPLAQHVHPLISVLVITALITLAMTWLVMPVLTRLLAAWLYPTSASTWSPITVLDKKR